MRSANGIQPVVGNACLSPSSGVDGAQFTLCRGISQVAVGEEVSCFKSAKGNCSCSCNGTFPGRCGCSCTPGGSVSCTSSKGTSADVVTARAQCLWLE